MSTEELPQIVAIFVNVFHKTEGYKIIFAKSNGIDLNGCEYKTLPSGIEKVDNDVVYFSHGEASQYIGLGVYRNLQAAGQPRQELTCVSIAVMVKSETQNSRHQRLNRVWLYNTALHELCDRFDPQESSFFDDVEHLYAQNHTRKDLLDNVKSKSPPASPVLSRFSSFKDYSSFREDRDQTQMTSKALLAHHELSKLHPVLSLHDMISFFGPLTFPLYRAALCRQRILIITETPVQRACHFIYNIQLLAAIPNSATTFRRPVPLRQLFCLGLNDIPQLTALATETTESGWIGTTTDRILTTKTHLYDVLVIMPSEATTQSLTEDRARPILRLANGAQINPSYLDGREFAKLKPHLPLYKHSNLTMRPQISWKRSTLDAIFSSFFYWASAGHFIDSVSASTDSDRLISDQVIGEETRLIVPADTSDSPHGREEVMTLIIFQRMTINVLAFLNELVSETVEAITITREQMVALGLTPRLASDVHFIQLLSMRWFSRQAIVDTSFCPCC